MRKVVDEYFTKASVRRFHEKQMTEAVLLAHDWLIAPAKWDQHLRRASASIILSVVYDSPPLISEQFQTADDIDDFTHRVTTAAAPGAHLVELFPWLRHVPSR